MAHRRLQSAAAEFCSRSHSAKPLWPWSAALPLKLYHRSGGDKHAASPLMGLAASGILALAASHASGLDCKEMQKDLFKRVATMDSKALAKHYETLSAEDEATERYSENGRFLPLSVWAAQGRSTIGQARVAVSGVAARAVASKRCRPCLAAYRPSVLCCRIRRRANPRALTRLR